MFTENHAFNCIDDDETVVVNTLWNMVLRGYFMFYFYNLKANTLVQFDLKLIFQENHNSTLSELSSI